VAILLNLVKSI